MKILNKRGPVKPDGDSKNIINNIKPINAEPSDAAVGVLSDPLNNPNDAEAATSAMTIEVLAQKRQNINKH